VEKGVHNLCIISKIYVHKTFADNFRLY